ncbi:DUF1059 domain-containing protein [Blastococcus sp. TF02A-35]|nr:DUF1059 domain-containing protein [Blastococcus sp. TF02A_35]
MVRTESCGWWALRRGMRGRAVKEYACGDVVPGCGASFRVSSEKEMLAVCTVHAQHDHGLAEPQMADDLIARIRAVIRSVA